MELGLRFQEKDDVKFVMKLTSKEQGNGQDLRKAGKDCKLVDGGIEFPAKELCRLLFPIKTMQRNSGFRPCLKWPARNLLNVKNVTVPIFLFCKLIISTAEEVKRLRTLAILRLFIEPSEMESEKLMISIFFAVSVIGLFSSNKNLVCIGR